MQQIQRFFNQMMHFNLHDHNAYSFIKPTNKRICISSLCLVFSFTSRYSCNGNRRFHQFNTKKLNIECVISSNSNEKLLQSELCFASSASLITRRYNEKYYIVKKLAYFVLINLCYSSALIIRLGVFEMSKVFKINILLSSLQKLFQFQVKLQTVISL